jgi:hypothetical protein
MALISKNLIEVRAIASNNIKIDQIVDLVRSPDGSGEVTKQLTADNMDATLGNRTPLVVINGYQVTRFLENFSLDMNGFMPVVSFTFTALESAFLSSSYPKDGDIVSVYIRSSEETYKPIRMDFNILDVDAALSSKMSENGLDSDALGKNLRFTIVAECRIPELYTHKSRSFRASSSFETLLEISQDLNLGFSTNDSDLNDTMNWICPNYSYYDFIADVTRDAYKDDNSFFMTFVDCYYNLNFINLGNQFLFSGDPQQTALFRVSVKDITVDAFLPGSSNPEPKKVPLVISNSWAIGSVPFAISGYILVSGAGQKSNKTGYFTRISYYDENNQTSNLEDKVVSYDIQSGTPDAIGIDTILQKGRARENIYRNERRIEWLGVVNEYSEDNPGTHPNYFHARYQNLMNIEDATKLILKVELLTYYAGIYRGQVLPVQIYVFNNSDRRKQNVGNLENGDIPPGDAPVLDRFLSGNYVVMGMEINWDESRAMKQVLTLAKREWTINTSGNLPKYSPLVVVEL